MISIKKKQHVLTLKEHFISIELIYYNTPVAVDIQIAHVCECIAENYSSERRELGGLGASTL